MHKVLKSVLQCFEEAHSIWLRLPKSPACLLPLGSSVSICQCPLGKKATFISSRVLLSKSQFPWIPLLWADLSGQTHCYSLAGCWWPTESQLLCPFKPCRWPCAARPSGPESQTCDQAYLCRGHRPAHHSHSGWLPAVSGWTLTSITSRFSHPVTPLCLRCSSNGKHLYFHFCPCCLLFSCSLMYPWVMSSFTQALWSWKTETTC